jgi:hypothetical protein
MESTLRGEREALLEPRSMAAGKRQHMLNLTLKLLSATTGSRFPIIGMPNPISLKIIWKLF